MSLLPPSMKPPAVPLALGAPVRKAESVTAEELASARVRQFEIGDHQPDGTVRPVRSQAQVIEALHQASQMMDREAKIRQLEFLLFELLGMKWGDCWPEDVAQVLQRLELAVVAGPAAAPRKEPDPASVLEA